MDGRRRADGRTDAGKQMDGWTDAGGWADRRTNRQTDGCMDIMLVA